jgi:hypothetical protein
MGMFVRVTLAVAALLVALVVLVFVLKLLVVAAVIAAVVVGLAFVVRGLQRRLNPNRPVRVTALTPRR